jgi:hypothetical protein
MLLCGEGRIKTGGGHSLHLLMERGEVVTNALCSPHCTLVGATPENNGSAYEDGGSGRIRSSTPFRCAMSVTSSAGRSGRCSTRSRRASALKFTIASRKASLAVDSLQIYDIAKAREKRRRSTLLRATATARAAM